MRYLYILVWIKNISHLSKNIEKIRFEDFWRKRLECFKRASYLQEIHNNECDRRKFRNLRRDRGKEKKHSQIQFGTRAESHGPTHRPHVLQTQRHAEGLPGLRQQDVSPSGENRASVKHTAKRNRALSVAEHVEELPGLRQPSTTHSFALSSSQLR